jgi:hypothetical protein
MTIARQQKGGKALSVITIDSPVEPDVLDQLARCDSGRHRQSCFASRAVLKKKAPEGAFLLYRLTLSKASMAVRQVV